MRIALAIALALFGSGCMLDRSGLVGPGPGLDAGATVDGGRTDAGRLDAGRIDAGRDDAGRDDAGRAVDGGRDAGMDAGRDAGREPSCEETFAAVEGFDEVCVEDDRRCTVLIDRPGILGTNGRSCAATCEDLGLSCVGSGPAGGGDGCASIISNDCATSYNMMVCVCVPEP